MQQLKGIIMAEFPFRKMENCNSSQIETCVLLSKKKTFDSTKQNIDHCLEQTALDAFHIQTPDIHKSARREPALDTTVVGLNKSAILW